MLGDGPLRPKLIEDLSGPTGTEGAATGLTEVRGMDVVGERVGKEDDLEFVLHLETVAEFHVLHKRLGEPFVEGILAKKLRLDSKVTGVKVSPLRGVAAKQVLVCKLGATALQPTHKWGDGLAGLAPARETKAGYVPLGVLTMELEMNGGKVRRDEDVVADDQSDGSLGERNSQIAGGGWAAVRLTLMAQTKSTACRELLQHLRGGIGGAVVDDDDFKISEGLELNMLQTELKSVGPIIRRNDETDGRSGQRRGQPMNRFLRPLYRKLRRP